MWSKIVGDYILRLSLWGLLWGQLGKMNDRYDQPETNISLQAVIQAFLINFQRTVSGKSMID